MTDIVKNPFDDQRLCGAKTALIEFKPDNQGRYQFRLSCQYTRMGLDSFQVGDLVAVENYSPPHDGDITYSILSLTQVYPSHFATQGPDAYPGHVFESMRTIKEDWEKQDDKILYPTTTINAFAVSTGWQFKYNSRKNAELPELETEKNLPMVGSEIRPISRDMVDKIINQGMEECSKSPFNHNKFEDINIKIDEEALLTTHFGVFGFTGVGKSNLVSSLVTALSAKGTRKPSNVIIVDPNDEYLGLLIDHFKSGEIAIMYIHVGPDSLPDPIINVLGSNDVPPAEVTELLYKQMKLPSKLKNDKDLKTYIIGGLENAIQNTRIALPAKDLGTLIRNTIFQTTETSTGAAVRDVLQDVERQWTNGLDGVPITADTLQHAVTTIGTPIGFLTPIENGRLGGMGASKFGTALGVIERTVRVLNRLQGQMHNTPPQAIIPTSELIQLLNAEDSRRIIIITGRRDSDVKTFVQIFGNELYESRRKEGTLEPFCVFLFDEADLFIPVEEGDTETIQIKEFCITLARRGRKFGLGIGISTQRASQLDTEVMGNLHTYFVSKLPRSYDRDKVAEAFGIGQEQLTPTFTFRPGNWLIISHDATGLKGVPIPVIAENANDRIKQSSLITSLTPKGT